MSELEDAIEGIRHIHESAMEEFIPNTSFFDNITEEEMFLLFLLLDQIREKMRGEECGRI